MKIAKISRMQATLQPDPFCRMTAPLGRTFRLFITCQDQAAFLQAKKVEDQVQRLCGNQMAVSCAWWNFALLRHDRLRDNALMEAAESEMIVISLSASGEMPSHVKAWLESWPVRPQAGQAALVTLLPGKKMMSGPQSHVAWLRRIAEDRGLDFFCNQDEWDVGGFLSRPFDVWTAARWTAPTAFSEQNSWHRGGINE
jgi:hypothetical protein